MQKQKNDAINVQQTFRRTLGKTTYEVSLYFSRTSTESAYDKLKRIIINDCRQTTE